MAKTTTCETHTAGPTRVKLRVPRRCPDGGASEWIVLPVCQQCGAPFQGEPALEPGPSIPVGAQAELWPCSTV